MKTYSLKRLVLVPLAFILAVMVFGSAIAEEYTANTMRLLRYEGTVEIEDANGNPRFVMENARFSSGEAMRTGENSMASISLDAAKILTLDAESRVAFQKNGNHLVLNLTAGTLLLDVQEKLDENESLDIQTSTMTVGIRGTILYVTTLDRIPERLNQLFVPSDAPALGTDDAAPSNLKEVLHFDAGENAGQVSQVGVLQGAVQLSFTDENGDGHSVKVTSGQKATLVDQNENDLVDTAPIVSDIEQEDMVGFLEDTITSDPAMYERVVEATDNLLPPIAFFSGSAEKVYDGSPLLCNEIKVVGLPEGFTYFCLNSGRQTAAGTSENTISGYRIYDAAKKDVTSSFADIAAYCGTLTVLPAPVGVTTASASKKYDGTPLTSPEASISGLIPGEAAAVKADGTILYTGTAENTYTIDWGETDPSNYAVTEYLGILEVTPNDTPIRFTASSARKVYDGTSLENGNVAVSGLPDGFSFNARTSGSQTKVGSSENTVTSCQIFDSDGVNVTYCFSNISRVSGSLTVEPLELAFDLSGAWIDAYGNLIIPNPSLTYLNGSHQGENVYAMRARSLTAGYNFILFTGDTVHLSVTATETAEDTYILTGECYFSEGADASYEISYTGEIEIPKPRILTLSIATSSASKPYDGTPLTSPEVTVTGLEDGDSVTVTATGSITEVGTAENTYTIDWGKTDPAKYTISESLGTLEITEAVGSVVMTAASAEKVYDGSPLADSTVTAVGLPDGFTFEAAASGSQTAAGESSNVIMSYKIFNADGVDVTANFNSVSIVNGKLTVTAAPVTVTTGSASKAYDGTPLKRDEASIAGLAEGESVTITVTGAITEIGSAENTYTIDWGETNPDNYIVTENLGTLEVTANSAAITLTAASAEKVYDGAPLADDSFTVTGLPDGLTCTATVSGSQKDVGESGNVIASYAILNSESADVTASFTSVAVNNGLLKVTPAAATITTGSAAKAYDGTPLTRADASISGLAEGESVTLTATGAITDVGTAVNTYTIDWGTANRDNYTVTENLGTLEVTASSAEITFTAASASKSYDGTALTDDFVTVSGLPANFTYEVTVTGSQKDAGESDNVITSYKIFNAENADVTANFTDVATVNGKLTVTPATVTITTESASKSYDAKPLTAGASIVGLAEGESVVLTATGAITDIGTAENTYTIDWGAVSKDNYTVTESIGTLEVTANNTAIIITSGSSSSEYTPFGLVNHEYTVEGLPDGFSIEVDITGSQAEVGSSANTIAGYTISKDSQDKTSSFSNVELVEGTLTLTKAKIRVWSKTETFPYKGSSYTPSVQWQGVYGSDNPMGTDLSITDKEWVKDAGEYNPTFTATLVRSDLLDKYEIGEVTFGTITITPAELTVTTGSASKPYDGTALTCDEASITGLVSGETAAVTATGTITDQGTAQNTYTIEWGTAKKDNYTIKTENLGTLEVTEPLAITLTAASAEKVYDGTALENSSVTAGGLPYGYTFEASASGSQLDAGTAPNVVNDGYIIRNAANEDVTDKFTVTKADGALTVNPLDVTVTIGDSVYAYDNAYHFAEVSVSCSAETTGEFLGDSAYRLRLPNAMLSLTFSDTARRKEAGNWSLSFSKMRWNYGNQSNYNVTTVSGSLTISRRPVTVRTGSAEKVYDGTPLTAPDATVENGIEGLTATATGTITEVGSTQNTYTLSLSEWYTDNLEIAEELGTLTVLPLEINVDLNAETRQFGAGASTNTINPVLTYANGSHAGETVTPSSSSCNIGTWEATYDLFTGDTLSLSVTDWADESVGSHTVYPSFSFSGDPSNFTVSCTNNIVTVTPASVTITTGSAEKVFDGTPLTAGVTVSGLVGDPRAMYAEDQLPVITATGSQTDAGSSQNTYTIDWRGYNPDNYTITENLGTLTVTRLYLDIDLGGGTWTYDFSVHRPNVSVMCENTSYTFTGDYLNFTDWVISWPWGDELNVHVEGMWKDAGEYTFEYSTTMNSGKRENYSILYTGESVIIKPAPITISTSSQSEEKPYDGTPLPESTDAPIVTGTFFEPIYVNPKYDIITDAGTADKTYEIDWGDANPDNYAITDDLGTLTVTPLEVEIDLGGYNYEEEDLAFYFTNVFHGPDVTASCDDEGFSVNKISDTDWEIVWASRGDVISVHAEGGGTEEGTYPFTYSASVTSGKPGNYQIAVTGGTVTIKPNRIYISVPDETPQIIIDAP